MEGGVDVTLRCGSQVWVGHVLCHVIYDHPFTSIDHSIID